VRHVEHEDAGSPKLPDVSASGIAHDAWLIYRMILTSKEYKHAPPRTHDGRPGVEWTGSVNKIIAALWPNLNERYLVTAEQANALKLELNRYLRNTRNVVCIRNGGVTSTSVWWVSNQWSPIQVRYVDKPVVTDPAAQAEKPEPEPEVSASDVFDVPAPEPTPLASRDSTAPPGASTEEEEMDDTLPDDGTGAYVCRVKGCTEAFNGGQGRASHERKHGVRFNHDGTTTGFDPERFGRSVTVGEVNRLVVDVLRESDGLTHGDLVEAVLSQDPTVLRDSVKAAIVRLMSKPWNGHQIVKVTSNLEDGKASYSRRLHLTSVKPTPASVPPRAPVARPPAVDEAIKAADAARDTTHDPSRVTVTQHADNLRALLTDLGRLEQLEAGLRASSAKNRELVEKLRVITAERDELQGKLDGLRALLGMKPSE
jgi:hypothetical protein